MLKRTFLSWTIFLALIISEIGITQSKKKINITSIENTRVKLTSQQPWFPYISFTPRGPIPDSRWQSYSIGDTLLSQSYPDSIEILVTTSQGDSERYWLGFPDLNDNWPGIVLFSAVTEVEASDYPNPGDGILQVNIKEPGYKKVSYRSFNDQRVYTFRMDWFRAIFPGGKQ